MTIRSSATPIAVQLSGALGSVLLVTSPLTWWLSGGPTGLVLGKLAAAFVLLTVYGVALRHSLSLPRSRSSALLAVSAGSVVLASVGAILLNVLAARVSGELDVSREAIHTFSEQTQRLLARLSEPVTLYGFFTSAEPPPVDVERMLSRYAEESPHISYELLDPEARPDRAAAFGIKREGPRLVAVAGQRFARAEQADESELTNAVIRATERRKTTVAFLNGHGELDFDDGETAEGARRIRDRIEAEGFATRSLSLLRGSKPKMGARIEGGVASKARDEAEAEAKPEARPEGEANSPQIPAGIDVLVVAGPRAGLPRPELVAIDRFLSRGGRVMLMVEPNTEVGLDAFLERWRIRLHDDFVVDTNPMNRLQGLGAASPRVVAAESQHPILANLAGAAILVTARSLEIVAEGTTGVRVQELLETGESAWGEVDYIDGAAELGPEDHRAPVTVAAVSTRSTTTIASQLAPEGRLVVIGDADFINNRNHTLEANTGFLLDALNYLASADERIVVRPHRRAASSIFLTGRQLAVLRIVTMDLIPGAIVALGIAIVAIRRRR
ncbi:MAG: Gldg family protein [Myxococcota bacterium]